MNVVLWVFQIVLAIINALHGWLYLTWSSASEERLQQRNPDGKPLGLNPAFRTFIGSAELLAAAGLILPGITGILPWLTSLASAGFMIIAGSAVVFHLRRQETSSAIGLAVMAVVAGFVAYMRWQIILL